MSTPDLALPAGASGLARAGARDGAGAGARAGSARSAAEVCGGPGDVRQRPRVQLLELLTASLNAEFWLTDEEVNSAAVRQRLLLTPVRHRSFATLEPGLGDGADPPKAATSAHATPSRTADGASGRIVSRVGQRPPRRPPRRRSSAARGRVAHSSARAADAVHGHRSVHVHAQQPSERWPASKRRPWQRQPQRRTLTAAAP